VSFFLRANKGGLEIPILWTALVLHTYNRRQFWSLAKPRVVLFCLVISLVGVGAKVELLRNEIEPVTLKTLTKTITQAIFAPIATRFSDEGNFRGFCQFINLWPEYRYLFQGYPEGIDALTSWIPRALDPNKRSQPTRGFGFMVHADAHTYPDETPAIGLVGSAYADDAFYSLTAYLLVAGLFLGILRRYAAGRRSALQWHISYLCFALFGGLSAESGITSVLYLFFLTFGATGLAHLAVVGLFKRKLHLGAVLAHSLPRGTDWSSRLLSAGR
jgi:hypothetical protein